MSTLVNKFRVSTAACAVAAAATLTPAVIANANPAAPLSPLSTSSVADALGGSALGSANLWWLGNNSNSAANSVVSPSTLPNHGPLYQILHNRLVWVGTPNPAPPADTRPIFEVHPLNLLPGFLRPFFGWFENLNFQACFAGFSVKVGPYGTVSATVGRHC